MKHVLVHGDNTERIYRVVRSEHINPLTKDFGAITAGNTLSGQEISELYVPDGVVAKYNFVPVDPVRVQIAPVAKAAPLGETRNTSPYVDREDTMRFGIDITTFYQFGDEKCYANINNPWSDDLSTSYVEFTGTMYLLEEVSETPESYDEIWLSRIKR